MTKSRTSVGFTIATEKCSSDYLLLHIRFVSGYMEDLSSLAAEALAAGDRGGSSHYSEAAQRNLKHTNQSKRWAFLYGGDRFLSTLTMQANLDEPVSERHWYGSRWTVEFSSNPSDAALRLVSRITRGMRSLADSGRSACDITDALKAIKAQPTQLIHSSAPDFFSEYVPMPWDDLDFRPLTDAEKEAADTPVDPALVPVPSG